MITPLGYGIKVNDGSSLERVAYVVNDPSSPGALADVAVKTVYKSGNYSGDYEFRSSGTVTFGTDVRAYRIAHVLYDVFGDHVKTLADVEVRDIASNTPSKLDATWRAWENDVSHYLTCITFVRQVRRADGTVWNADMQAIGREVGKIIPNLAPESLEPEKPQKKDESGGKK